MLTMNYTLIPTVLCLLFPPVCCDQKSDDVITRLDVAYAPPSALPDDVAVLKTPRYLKSNHIISHRLAKAALIYRGHVKH